jgi:misacylated tRNA(Ala) deacylase
MTQLIYLNNMYKKEFDAKITDIIDEKFVILDKTCFYPNSGGVECDFGKIISDSGLVYKVIFVKKSNGEIIHEIETDKTCELKKGNIVHGIIDWERRYKLMKYHTSAHVLSAVFAKEAKALITGNSLNVNKGRIDFSVEDFDKEQMQNYIDIANKIIEQNLEVKVYNLTRNEVEQNSALCKLAKGLPPNLDILRIVDIDGYDAQPDGGAHVKSLSEVGKINFLKAENKGAKNRRVYYELIEN